MIIVMKPAVGEHCHEAVIHHLSVYKVECQVRPGDTCDVIGVVGDTSGIDRDVIANMEGVDKVVSVSEPYKKANRKFHPQDTVVAVGDVRLGGGNPPVVIAGPCSVESREQVCSIAREVKAAGAAMLRGGAYKPRTSPYAFQGLEREGLELLQAARTESGLPVVTEILSPRHVEMFDLAVDVIQVGARNMQNFDLLKEVGHCRKPILLKRGLSSTLEEWLMSAEYIMAAGNPNVILCERGIRTFETYTRNTLDLSAIPAIRAMSHLPIVVDPSHATGKSWMVPQLALAAIAVGADGLVVEVHNDPPRALCDGAQSITPADFAAMMRNVTRMIDCVRDINGCA